MKYFFIGTSTVIGHVDPAGRTAGKLAALETLGESVEGDEAEADEWMRGGCALVSESDWDASGISSQEVKDFAKPGQQANAPDEFKGKLTKLRAIYSAKWQDLHGYVDGKPAPQIQMADIKPPIPPPAMDKPIDESQTIKVTPPVVPDSVPDGTGDSSSNGESTHHDDKPEPDSHPKP